MIIYLLRIIFKSYTINRSNIKKNQFEPVLPEISAFNQTNSSALYNVRKEIEI